MDPVVGPAEGRKLISARGIHHPRQRPDPIDDLAKRPPRGEGAFGRGLRKLDVDGEEAIGIEPDEPRYHQYLGFVYESLGRHEEAVQHFKTVMELEGADDDDF